MLIEIENPKKRWFNAKGITTPELNEAKGQIADWKAWFADAGNVVQFQRLYWLEQNWWRRLPMFVEYILVYGRASEFEGRDELVRRRRGLEPENTTIMTYDRIKPLDIAKDFPCAPVQGEHLTAKWFPPTFEIHPIHVEEGIGRLLGRMRRSMPVQTFLPSAETF